MKAAPSPEVLREILQGLDLSDAAVSELLNHLENFCRSHGGERHYAELLCLVDRMKSAQASA